VNPRIEEILHFIVEFPAPVIRQYMTDRNTNMHRPMNRYGTGEGAFSNSLDEQTTKVLQEIILTETRFCGSHAEKCEFWKIKLSYNS
jgi:hypothetical protein